MTLRRRVAVLEKTAAQRDATERPAVPHPIPDLTGKPIEVIVDAVFAAISEAHSAQGASEDPVPDGLCQSCLALIEVASRYCDPTGKAWPDPVRRLMADVLDEWIAGRKTSTR